MYNNSSSIFHNDISETTRRAIGIVLLCVCICFWTFYIYIVTVIIGHRLWKVNSFYLWFLSLAFGDIGVLTIYLYSTTSIVWQRHLFDDHVLSHVDSTNDFFVINCYIQHPFMALVRMAGIVFPLKSRRWLTNSKTIILIVIAWVTGIINVIVVDSYSGDSGYFNPQKMAWEMSDLDLYYQLGLHYYWAAINGICVSLSMLFYAICFWRLRQSKQKSRSQTNQNRNTPTFSKAELNLMKVGFVLTVLFAADMILWQITQDRHIAEACGWWLPFMFTIFDILFYGMNSIMIATLSSDIQKRMCIPPCGSKYTERSLVSNGSVH